MTLFWFWITCKQRLLYGRIFARSFEHESDRRRFKYMVYTKTIRQLSLVVSERIVRLVDYWLRDNEAELSNCYEINQIKIVIIIRRASWHQHNRQSQLKLRVP
jgi:hypothetical protein